MTEYTQLPQDSLPQSGLTDLSITSESTSVKKRPGFIDLSDSSIQQEDEEILIVIKYCLNLIGISI